MGMGLRSRQLAMDPRQRALHGQAMLLRFKNGTGGSEGLHFPSRRLLCC